MPTKQGENIYAGNLHEPLNAAIKSWLDKKKYYHGQKSVMEMIINMGIIRRVFGLLLRK